MSPENMLSQNCLVPADILPLIVGVDIGASRLHQHCLNYIEMQNAIHNNGVCEEVNVFSLCSFFVSLRSGINWPLGIEH